MIINDYIIKEEQYQINSLTLNFIDVEKERTKLSQEKKENNKYQRGDKIVIKTT